LALTGPGALEEELSEYLGYDKPDPTGRSLGNSRNGYPVKDGRH
jgi:hypothetical protein